jgi:uncharacterized Zn finger protein
MRLVDVDAVTYETITRAGDDEAVEVILRCDLESLPTVRCEECGQWRRHELPNTSGWGTCRDTHVIIEGKGRLFMPPDFGCAHFERRAT